MWAAVLAATAVRGIIFLAPGGLFGRVAMVILITSSGLHVLCLPVEIVLPALMSCLSQSFTVLFE